tara:strand:+ start:58 stop:450 length:393 start_codon:yes stop_codon:yes gene_type:complete
MPEGFDTSTFGKKMFEKRSREMLAPDLYMPEPPSLEEKYGKDFLQQRAMELIEEMQRDREPFSPLLQQGAAGMLGGSEEERFKKMEELNGTTFDNGDRSQGDQEAEQRMNQNKKTSLANRAASFLNIFGQ